MRIAGLALAVVLCACETAGETSPAPDPTLAAAELAEAKALPDFKPETVSACNAVPLNVDLATDGALSVNGEETDLDGLGISARRKNDACRNAPAMVVFTVAPGAPAAKRQTVLNTLSSLVVNLGVVEVGS